MKKMYLLDQQFYIIGSNNYITTKELYKIGFNDERIKRCIQNNTLRIKLINH